MSDSEDEAATEVHEPPRRWKANDEAQEPENEAQSTAQTLIDDLEAAGWSIGVILQTHDHHEVPAAAIAVQDKISALLRMADDAAASMNNELRVQLVKIPKQVWQGIC